MTGPRVSTDTSQGLLHVLHVLGNLRFPALPLPFSERRALLVVQDLLAVNGALALTLTFWQYAAGEHWGGGPPQLLWFVVLSMIYLPLAQAFDAYNLHVAAHLRSSSAAMVRAGLVVSLLYLVIPFVTPTLPHSRLALAAFPVLMMALLVAERSLYVLVLGQPIFHRRALIIGAGWAGRAIAQTLAEQGTNSYQLVGFVDDDPVRQGKRIVMAGAGESRVPLRVLGTGHDLPALITEHRISTLILAAPRSAESKLLRVLMDCLELGVDLIPMPVLYEQLTGRVPVAHVGGSWDVAMPIEHAGTGTLRPLIKRLMDLTLAGVGLALSAPFLPLIALAIRIDSPGPILYSQERVGRGGRIFRVYKFRSMVVDAEKDGAMWAQRHDPRVTRVGRFLRRSHLDELPQLWNILKGDMSVVGPRPERPEFAAELARAIPFYRVRHAVKPGAAGWALVKQGYGASKEDALLKLQYDLYYIKHQSVWLDIVILLKTVASMVTLCGR